MNISSVESSSQQSRPVKNDVIQDITPESNEFSMEGFNNYSSAEAFIQGLAGLVNQGDVETMIRAQKQMLQRFEKTNEMLLNCNALSQSRLKQANDEFKKHCKVLSDMKKDLDYVFKKLRVIKQKLNTQYPVAYAEASLPQRSSLAEEAEDDAEVIKKKITSDSPGMELNAPTTSKATVDSRFTKPAKSSTTVEYVQMNLDEGMDNGKPESDLIKRVCSVESTNPNDSSDCTSEDTG